MADWPENLRELHHALQSPLTSLSGALQLLEVADPESAELVEVARRGTARLREVAAALLAGSTELAPGTYLLTRSGARAALASEPGAAGARFVIVDRESEGAARVASELARELESRR